MCRNFYMPQHKTLNKRHPLALHHTGLTEEVSFHSDRTHASCYDSCYKLNQLNKDYSATGLTFHVRFLPELYQHPTKVLPKHLVGLHGLRPAVSNGPKTYKSTFRQDSTS